jgi:hypothetical protein
VTEYLIAVYATTIVRSCNNAEGGLFDALGAELGRQRRVITVSVRDHSLRELTHCYSNETAVDA